MKAGVGVEFCDQCLQVINVVAGSLAGALTAVFVCPLDVLKTRLQVQGTQALDRRYQGIHGSAHQTCCLSLLCPHSAASPSPAR